MPRLQPIPKLPTYIDTFYHSTFFEPKIYVLAHFPYYFFHSSLSNQVLFVSIMHTQRWGMYAKSWSKNGILLIIMLLLFVRATSHHAILNRHYHYHHRDHHCHRAAIHIASHLSTQQISFSFFSLSIFLSAPFPLQTKMGYAVRKGRAHSWCAPFP